MTSSYSRGQQVWYRTRDGTQVPAKVVGVDLTIRPVSYAIRLDGADHDRDTESPRLAPRSSNEAAPAEVHLHNVSEQRAKVQSVLDEAVRADDDDDFGDFAAAGSPVVSRPASQEGLTPQDYEMPGSKASLVSAATRHALGTPQTQWAVARPQERNAGGAQLLPERSVPIPLEFFGGEDDFEEEAKVPDPTPWYSKPDFPYMKQDTIIPGNRAAYDVATALMNHAEQLPPRPATISNPHILAALQDFGTEPGELSRPVNISAAEPQGGSPLGSDDYGDFEDAQPSSQTPSASPQPKTHLQSVQAPVSPIVPQSAFVGSISRPESQNSAGVGLSETRTRRGSDASNVALRQGNGSGQSHGGSLPSWEAGDAAELPKQRVSEMIEDEEDDGEMPWYMDPVTYRQSKEQSGDSWAGVPTPQAVPFAAPSAQHVQPVGVRPRLAQTYGQPGFPSTLPVVPGILRSPLQSRSNSNEREINQQIAPVLRLVEDRSSPTPATQSHNLPGLAPAQPYQPAFVGMAPIATSSSLFDPGLAQVQPAYNPAAAPTYADTFASAQPGYDRLVERLHQETALRGGQSGASPYLEQSQIQAVPKILPSTLSRTESYPVVWTQMMQICAEELQRGQEILRREQNLARVESLLANQRGRDYLQALGQLHLASQLLDNSMRTHVSAERRPPAFQTSLEQCLHAWNSDVEDKPLEDVVLRVAPLVRQRSQHIPNHAARAVTEGSRWRGWSDRQQNEEPQWQEGLCGISLLPLEHLSDLHVAPWVQEKPCLVPPPLLPPPSTPTHHAI